MRITSDAWPIAAASATFRRSPNDDGVVPPSSRAANTSTPMVTTAGGSVAARVRIHRRVAPATSVTVEPLDPVAQQRGPHRVAPYRVVLQLLLQAQRHRVGRPRRLAFEQLIDIRPFLPKHRGGVPQPE